MLYRFLIFWLLSFGWAYANQPSLLDGGVFGQAATSLLSASNGPLYAGSSGGGSAGGSSLFADRAVGGMFEIRVLAPVNSRVSISAPFRPGIRGLRQLIGRAEAGRKGYDAVQYGARIKPSKPPTQMTLAEIYAWIDATPGQPHAIGLYQFIPKTLRSVALKVGVSEHTRFSPEVQDALADVLFNDAGYQQFMAGNLSQTGFMNNLAKIWAGFPNSTGRSHYHGYAGNYATLTWAQFDAAMVRIFR